MASLEVVQMLIEMHQRHYPIQGRPLSVDGFLKWMRGAGTALVGDTVLYYKRDVVEYCTAPV